jgi:hypothetical protein
MTDPKHHGPILAAIVTGIDVARKNWSPDQPALRDDFTAWVILQELRRSGWTIGRDLDPPPEEQASMASSRMPWPAPDNSGPTATDQ